MAATGRPRDRARTDRRSTSSAGREVMRLRGRSPWGEIGSMKTKSLPPTRIGSLGAKTRPPPPALLSQSDRWSAPNRSPTLRARHVLDAWERGYEAFARGASLDPATRAPAAIGEQRQQA
jgi:hypothetical protein